jgi:alpha-N-acetylglucosaminidase
MMLSSGEPLPDVFLHDLAVVAGQAVANHALVLRDQMAADYTASDIEAFEKSSTAFLRAIADVDRIASTRTESLLGKWIEDARGFGSNDSERNALEQNARTILTTWGEKDTHLNEYANRNWGGLIEGYYVERWRLFIEDLRESLQSGKPFDAAAFHEKITAFEWGWTSRHEPYPSAPTGETYKVARELFTRYAQLIRAE